MMLGSIDSQAFRCAGRLMVCRTRRAAAAVAALRPGLAITLAGVSRPVKAGRVGASGARFGGVGKSGGGMVPLFPNSATMAALFGDSRRGGAAGSNPLDEAWSLTI
jgi:hypothetical protein